MKRMSGLAFACPQYWPVGFVSQMFVFLVCCVALETLLVDPLCGGFISQASQEAVFLCLINIRLATCG